MKYCAMAYRRGVDKLAELASPYVARSEVAHLLAKLIELIDDDMPSELIPWVILETRNQMLTESDSVVC
jgi:hypothetical protein